MFDNNYYLILCSILVVLLNIDDISARSTKSQNNVSTFLNFQEPRIVNGTAATLNATRHQVSLRSKSRDSFFFGAGHLCGGSLISENVVLTAAHCVVDYTKKKPTGTFHPDNYFKVVMGDLDRFEYTNNTLVFDVLKIVKHVDVFNLKTFQHDIVLVILDGKVPAKHPTVRPIILNDGPVKNNTLCQVTGWGAIEHGGEESDVLLTVDLPIIDRDDCIQKTLYEDLVTEGMICAGYLEGGKDSCTGDSGGALVCEGIQTGLVSWGSGCAQPLTPGVFTNVAFYKDWILEEVQKNNGTLPKFAGDNNNAGNVTENVTDNVTDNVTENVTDNVIDNVGNGDSDGNSVAGLSCSLILICLLFIFNLFLSEFN